MIVSLDNLNAGIEWWRSQDARDWPKDFLNSFYYDIYRVRDAGVTEQWWTATVGRLGQWRAYRGQSPPNTKADITQRGLQRLNAVASGFTQLLGSSATEPCIDSLCWVNVASLYALALEIKSSHVFSGKMCHLLFPKLFIVMDNKATNVSEYELYWRGMKDAWNDFEAKSEARNLLTSTVESDKPLHPLYPLETKIMELSHIGLKNHKSNQLTDWNKSKKDTVTNAQSGKSIMSVEHVALTQVEAQLQQRGFETTRKARNSPEGDIHAQRGERRLRFEVKGLAQRSAVWLKKRQVSAVDIVVIYVVQDEDVWVLSPVEACALLDAYREDFTLRRGRPPAAEGFNQSQLPKPTGWLALDRLL